MDIDIYDYALESFYQNVENDYIRATATGFMGGLDVIGLNTAGLGDHFLYPEDKTRSSSFYSSLGSKSRVKERETRDSMPSTGAKLLETGSMLAGASLQYFTYGIPALALGAADWANHKLKDRDIEKELEEAYKFKELKEELSASESNDLDIDEIYRPIVVPGPEGYIKE